MNLIEKKDLESVIGKADFWNPKQIAGLCDYVGGVHEIDALTDAQGFLNAPPLVNFKVHEHGLEVSLMIAMRLHYIAIPLANLASVELEVGGTIDTEERSVVGRAIIGGLLLGPLGAVVGGVSGLKDKVVKDNDMLLVNVKHESTETNMLLTIKKGKSPEVRKFFATHYGSKFRVNS